jgi:superfamily I DNA/RNA helicase
MPKIAISADFLEAYAQIPKSHQKRVREFTEKFCEDPTTASINYESIYNMRDSKVRTVRIGLDYRAIVIHPHEGDVYLLVWVDHHDEAMRWAKNKRFEVSATTGALQVIDTEYIDSITSDVSILSDLFSSILDEQLLLVGVPQILLPSVRAIMTIDELGHLQPHLSAEVYERLFYIGSGMSLDEVIHDINPTIVHSTDSQADIFELALENEDTKRRFSVVSSTEDIRMLLDAPLEKWRVFLHPSQRRLAEGQYDGPVKVLGGAGTGKTVVLLHRVKHIASELAKTGDAKRILVLTYTSNLAKVLKIQLESLLPVNEMSVVEVSTVHSWAIRFLQSQGFKATPISVENRIQVDRVWQDAYSTFSDKSHSLLFYKEEWDEVVQRHGIISEEEYLRALRIGRGTRLERNARRGVWSLLAHVRKELSRLGLMEWPDIVREARNHLENNNTSVDFISVMVDETQDLHLEDLKLIRAIVPPAPNDLFLVGDAHQRIYKNKVVLSHCGIHIRGGRSKRLRLNYRTTEQIRQWAVGLLTGEMMDDLDGGNDDLSSYTSLLHGKEPEVHHFVHQEDELSFIREALNSAILEDIDLSSICLVARNSALLEQHYAPMLANDHIPYVILNPSLASQGEGVRLATMHRVKGLEFSYVFIVSVNEQVIPPISALESVADEVSHKDLVKREKSLLYVAATRARNYLIVTSYGKQSSLLVDNKGV